MSGEIRRKHWEHGMTGADMILAVVSDRCPACRLLLDLDRPFHGVLARSCGKPADCLA